MFFTTNPPDPESVNTDAIAALNEFVAGERKAATVLRLSDIDRATARVAASLWTQIPVDVRRFVARQMLEQAEANIDLNFSRMFLLGLDDPDAEIRSVSIQGLWEDESTTFLERLLDMLRSEREPAVREAVAEALGAFSLRAFEEQLDPKWSGVIRLTLLDLYRSNESIGVRKNALISLGYFCNDPDVEAAILDAFSSPYHDLNTAALYAMGLNLNDRWFETLLGAMIDEDPEIRFEAVRAIGRFGDERALTQVLDRLEDEDREVQLSAIEALGEIGGRTAQSTLQRLTRSDDAVIREAADDALHGIMVLSDSPRISP